MSRGKIRILCALGLLVAAACGPSRWSPPPDAGAGCAPSAALQGDPRWPSSFGALKPAHGCLQVSWSNGEQPKALSLPVVLKPGGELLALDEKSGQYDGAPTFTLPSAERRWARRFRVYVLSPKEFTPDRHKSACQALATPAYDCFALARKQECWFYIEFRPQSQAFQGQVAPLIGGGEAWCKIVTGYIQAPPPEPSPEPIPDGAPDTTAPDVRPKEPPAGSEPLPPCKGENCPCVPQELSREVLKGTHDKEITDVDFSPNGVLFASASLDGKVKIFRVDRQELSRTYTAPNGFALRRLSFNNNGAALAAISETRIFTWPTEGNQKFAELRHNNRIADLAFHPTEELTLLTVLASGHFVHWRNGKEQQVQRPTNVALTEIAVGHDKNYVAISSIGRVRTYPLQTVKLDKETDLGISNVRSLSIHPNDRLIALGDDKGRLIVWDRVAAKSLHQADLRQGPITRLRFHPKLPVLAVAYERSVGLYQIAVDGKHKLLHLLKNGHTDSPIKSLAWNPKGTFLVMGTGSGDLLFATCDD